MQQIRLLDDFALRLGGFRLSLHDFACRCGGELCELSLQRDQGFAGSEYFDMLPAAVPAPVAVPMLGFDRGQRLFDAEGHAQVGGEFGDLLVRVHFRMDLRSHGCNRRRGERVDDVRPSAGRGSRPVRRPVLLWYWQVGMLHISGSGQIGVAFVDGFTDRPSRVGGGHELDAQRFGQGFDHAQEQFVKQSGHVPCELFGCQP